MKEHTCEAVPFKEELRSTSSGRGGTPERLKDCAAAPDNSLLIQYVCLGRHAAP